MISQVGGAVLPARVTMETVNVLVVEPHPHRRRRLLRILARRKAVCVLGHGPDIITACRSISRPRLVNVLILDIDQPLMHELKTWAAVHLLLREARVLALTGGEQPQVLSTALAVRVNGLHYHALTSVRSGERFATQHWAQSTMIRLSFKLQNGSWRRHW